MAVENKQSICALGLVLRMKIKVFNPFKRDLVVCIRRITNTNSVAIRNYCLGVPAHLVGLAFKDNKRQDNMAVSANCLCNRNSFTAKRLACLALCCLIIDNKYLLFLALPYIYA
jgi:hypothetical protein